LTRCRPLITGFFIHMKELKEYFTGKGQVKGYIFNQISKTKFAYLYEVKKDDLIHYEVFKRRKNTLYDCISYPSDKAFGIWAWTLMDLESAKSKLKEITLHESLKKNV
jgi:hypothetical protein